MIGSGSSLSTFCAMTVNAFFDNDLLLSTQIFVKNAKGSFGLVVSSTLDAHRQLVIAARGQPVSTIEHLASSVFSIGSAFSLQLLFGRFVSFPFLSFPFLPLLLVIQRCQLVFFQRKV